MAKEMEAKVKIDKTDELQALIRKLGGEEKYARFEVNIFYDTSQRKLEDKGEVLRLRKEVYSHVKYSNYDCECDCHNPSHKESVSMTFKGKRIKGKLKIREEHEFNVSDFEQARLLLTSLGYKEYFRFEKKRRAFSFDGCSVEFDTLPYLGHFVEVEGSSENKIYKVLTKLGLQDQKLITEGYGGLIWADAKKHKRSKKMALFAKGCHSWISNEFQGRDR
jgi:adenylate cyclase class IV